VSVCYFHFNYYHAVNDPPYSVCIRLRSRRLKESQRSYHHRSHHRPRHRSRSRSRSASTSDRHKRSRRSSRHRSVSTTHEQSPPAETSSKYHVTSRHHKKKKAKEKSSKSHHRHLTPTSTDTSPSVEEPLSERRLVIVGRVKQQQVPNDIVDKTVSHDSESSNEERCLDEGDSNSWQHSPSLHSQLLDNPVKDSEERRILFKT